MATCVCTHGFLDHPRSGACVKCNRCEQFVDRELPDVDLSSEFPDFGSNRELWWTWARALEVATFKRVRAQVAAQLHGHTHLAYAIEEQIASVTNRFAIDPTTLGVLTGPSQELAAAAQYYAIEKTPEKLLVLEKVATKRALALSEAPLTSLRDSLRAQLRNVQKNDLIGLVADLALKEDRIFDLEEQLEEANDRLIAAGLQALPSAPALPPQGIQSPEPADGGSEVGCVDSVASSHQMVASSRSQDDGAAEETRLAEEIRLNRHLDRVTEQEELHEEKTSNGESRERGKIVPSLEELADMFPGISFYPTS